MDGIAAVRRSAERGTRRRQAPRLRAARLEDHDQINQLAARHGLDALSLEEWSHLWLDNPAYREIGDDWSIGWVLEDDRHRIVGSVGNIPVWYAFDGKRILAASSHAWVVEPEYRSAGLVLLDSLINQDGVDLFVSTTVSAASTPGIEAFGCPRVPVGVWDRSAFWITHHQGFLESLLTLKHYPFAKALSYPLAAAVGIKDQLTSKVSGARVEVTECATFDERFDLFWEELRRRHPHVLLAYRTVEVLKWHYKHRLATDRLWIAAVTDGPRLLAYAVFERRDKPHIGLTRVQVADFVSLDGGPDLLPPLLDWALRRCRDERIHMLECCGRWLEEGELVDRLAPYRREMPTWVYVYRAIDPALAKRLEDWHAWAPTLFDGDASLISEVPPAGSRGIGPQSISGS